MVNYVLSFCKITGASKIFKRNFYLPLLKPLTPKDAFRTLRITGKWLLGAKYQHYIPVLLNHRKKRSTRSKDFGKKVHENNNFIYMTPTLDSENENHKILLKILEDKSANGQFVYTVNDKKYNIVLQAQLERAILDGDVVDVLVSQKNDKIIVKLKSLKKIPIDMQSFQRGDENLYCGEGATTAEQEKHHHHGKYTMGLAQIFEDKEMDEEKWEQELKKMMKRRKRQAREGTKEWKEMYKESIKNLNWKKFEEEAKKVIEDIEEPAVEEEIEMDIDDLETTKNVNETILRHGTDYLDKLPTMKEIPDIIKSMGNATLHDIEDEDELSDASRKSRRVSGVKVTLSSGKECFVSGQMVHTEDGDVFVPGQTVENEFGLEYAPGITINIDNKPTLINGLIMGEEEAKPMFLPTQSTITADGQLTFATAPEERPKPQPEKRKKKKFEIIEEILEIEMDENDESPEESVNVIVLGEISDSSDSEENVDSEEIDFEAIRLKQDQQRLELEKLKMILMDDGLDDILASIEEKREKLKQKLEELRKLSVCNENSLVTFILESDTAEIAAKITDDTETINRLSDILMTMTRRAATLRDKNSIYADNINQACIFVPNMTDADIKFNKATNKVKMLLKTAAVAANDVFKNRPRDQILALQSIGDILVDVLKNDPKALKELLDLMNTPIERSEVCNSIFKTLSQNITETKVSILGSIAKTLSPGEIVESLEKMLKRQPDDKCEAFVKVAENHPEILSHFTDNVQRKFRNLQTEEQAAELLHQSIEHSAKAFKASSLKKLMQDQNKLEGFKDEVIGFARALGLEKIEGVLMANPDLKEITDKGVVELLERVTLIDQLSEKDYSLRKALERLKKNPERSRGDPRIRQLIRESNLLLPQSGGLLRNSRDIPLQLLKSKNLLAIEDWLMQRTKIDSPVLISRNSIQAVVPKEAERGVLSGRINYVLIDESGVTNLKPMHMYGVNKNRETYLNSGIRDRSSERDGDRTYLQAKNNVRKLKKLYNHDCRQVA